MRARGFLGWRAAFLTVLWLALAPRGKADEPATMQGEKQPNVVAVFRLSGPLSEAPVDETFAMFAPVGTTLRDLVARLGKAAADPRVKAVVILPETAGIGMAQTEELRKAIGGVRARGKEVYVHADSLMLSQYLLACGASRVSVVPTGLVLIPGMHGSSLHIRGLLDKIGVKPDFITEGAYKSAAELFMREQPSAEADEMMNWLLDSWFAGIKDEVAGGRKVDDAKAQAWLDGGLYTANQAREVGLIDAVEQRDDFVAMLKDRYGKDAVFKKKYGREAAPTVDFSSPLALFKIWGDLLRGPEKKEEGKPAVGIVYVTGPIMDGRGEQGVFGEGQAAFSGQVRDALDKAAKDDSVKAVVLRVDSPGGSATASEVILDATKRVKAKKPLVVSMGDVAGSGGYYVACGAEKIFADPATLTGSIGVVAGKLATTEMWKKIGVTFKEYKRGQNAGILSSEEVFTDGERARMRAFMDEVYGTFKGHVTEIRGGRLKKAIDDLAGGRVYTGKQALDLGLVDAMGGLSDAVAYAAEQAKIADYDTKVVPEPKNLIEKLSEQLSGGKEEPDRIDVVSRGGSLLKLAAPYLQFLDPHRAAAVTSALLRLAILQTEGVAVTMPEIAPGW